MYFALRHSSKLRPSIYICGPAFHNSFSRTSEDISYYITYMFLVYRPSKPVDSAHDTHHSFPSPFPVCRPIRLMCRFPTVVSLSPIGIGTPLGSTTSLPELVLRESPFSSLSSEKLLFRVSHCRISGKNINSDHTFPPPIT